MQATIQPGNQTTKQPNNKTTKQQDNQTTRQPDNQTTINVWKTLPSKARVTRDKVSGLQPTSKATVWKTVPIPSD